MSTTPVLIVGAGPSGLVLALSLARRGIPFRIISDAAGPAEYSRAMAVQARTLEFYDQFGFAEEMVHQGIPALRAHVREAGANGRGREILSLSFHHLGEGLSPFPYPLAYPQDEHERFLAAKLADAGASIEWRSRLTGFSQDEHLVRATIDRGGQTEVIQAEYICGCDGAHSQVRESLGIGFPGGTYEQVFYVADVKVAGEFQRDLSFTLGKNILTVMVPVRSSGMQRLIGLVPPEWIDRSDFKFENIRSVEERLMDIQITEVNWFSTYRVHHRVASRFRASRGFLLGDAGHIHSPVGGQGMNTGIGDAVNLGWKLAHVLQGRAAASLLDTYEPERLAFARTLVSTTDRAFTPLVSEGITGEFTRRVLAPLFMTVASGFTLSRHAMFRLISQTRIHYSNSPLSEGRAGEIEGGDRLPWVQTSTAENFAPLRSLDWQAHIYGDIEEPFAMASAQLNLPVHRFLWSDAALNAGLKHDAAYLIRPDGHVALASPEQSPTELKRFVERHGLRFPARKSAA